MLYADVAATKPMKRQAGETLPRTLNYNRQANSLIHYWFPKSYPLQPQSPTQPLAALLTQHSGYVQKVIKTGLDKWAVLCRSEEF